jgi:NitT/TauT family transport system ATP-binding protein
MLANNSVLLAQGIGLRYPGQSANVLSHFDLSLRKGEIVTVLGPSGIGKSSLLRVLAGLQNPTEGAVSIGQLPMQGVHPRVAIAFQDPSLLPWLTLEKNVGFGLDFRSQPQIAAAERRERVAVAIDEGRSLACARPVSIGALGRHGATRGPGAVPCPQARNSASR